jgi:GT2 family glycosyltransferase
VISIVCVYNNKTVLEDWLLQSLQNQTSNYELILVDNTQKEFKSAAQALNWGGQKAKGGYVMFVHQDVDLRSTSWLEDTGKLLDSIPNLGIAGVAGTRRGKTSRMREVVTNIEHGTPPMSIPGTVPLQRPEKVQTLDECLVIIPRPVFHMLQFDEKVCDDWHLYAVDYCLSVVNLGLSVYVIPIFIYHRSTAVSNKSLLQTISSIGSLPAGYYQSLGKLLKKHRSHIKQFYTTTGYWSTSYPLTLQRAAIVGRLILNRLLVLFLGEKTAQRLVSSIKGLFRLSREPFHQ